MSWFKQAEEKPKPITVVELEKLPPLQETQETVSAVASLRSHAGFQWLTRKLKIQSARLEAELKNTKHPKIEDYYFLQSGIQWCNWLSQQVDFAHERYQSMRPATPQERMHIQDIESVIELIRPPQPQVE